MKKVYIVGVHEVHVRHYSVNADSEEEAKDLVHQQDESVIDRNFEEFSHCLDRDTWSVEEIPHKQPSSQSSD